MTQGISDRESSEGYGASRVPFWEAITAVLDVLDQCTGDLLAVRHRLRQNEMPDELDTGESDLPRPAE